jgi:hypothetical protein
LNGKSRKGREKMTPKKPRTKHMNAKSSRFFNALPAARPVIATDAKTKNALVDPMREIKIRKYKAPNQPQAFGVNSACACRTKTNAVNDIPPRKPAVRRAC